MSGSELATSDGALATGYVVLSLGSATLAGVHGFRRGGFWPMVGWALAGFVFPIVTPTAAFAQGFGRKRRK